MEKNEKTTVHALSAPLAGLAAVGLTRSSGAELPGSGSIVTGTGRFTPSVVIPVMRSAGLPST